MGVWDLVTGLLIVLGIGLLSVGQFVMPGAGAYLSVADEPTNPAEPDGDRRVVEYRGDYYEIRVTLRHVEGLSWSTVVVLGSTMAVTGVAWVIGLLYERRGKGFQLES